MKEPAWKNLHQFARFEDNLAVDDDVLDAFRIAMRLGVSSTIDDLIRIEDNDIREQAFSKLTSICLPQPACRHLRHLVDGGFKGKNTVLTNVFAENAWK